MVCVCDDFERMEHGRNESVQGWMTEKKEEEEEEEEEKDDNSNKII